MNNVSNGPDVGQGSDAPDAPPDDHTRATVIPDGPPPPRLNFADLAAVRAGWTTWTSMWTTSPAPRRIR